ncbi:cytochrome c [Halomonas aquamarina]|uniref:Cytochrome c n=1 Tax=Vreelandella aquamarina TaxID=77097 RepID=A0ACC5VUB5_9GAMM|nr:cytochrome c [Halomonas aquamarina]MBZ5487468.1 cytochrome c [Halomonas aquamarina]
MSNRKRTAIALGVGAAVVVAGAFVWAWPTFDISRSDVADDETRLADFTSQDEDAIARGEYVMRLGDCMACHEENFGGGYTVSTPFGGIVASNISPDIDSGIGNMTERDFFNALRHGRGSKGLLYPAMPYTEYTKLTDRDMHDLWAYMSTIEPVDNAIDEIADLGFPYNIRLAMAGWNVLFFDNEGFDEHPDQDEQWNRGRYIVNGPGHCATCHTSRNFLGGPKDGEYLSGGGLDIWFAPDITSNPHTGIGSTSTQELVEYLKTGANSTSFATGPMAEAIEHSTQYFTDDDLEAVASYLKATAPSSNVRHEPMTLNNEGPKSGALAYEVNCSACHGVAGEGMANIVPAFEGNNALLADDPTNLIHVMLMGGRAAHTQARPTGAGMPSFAWKMNDEEIATVLDHVRNSWGNGAAPVSVERVAELRSQLAARDKLATPQDEAHTD